MESDATATKETSGTEDAQKMEASENNESSKSEVPQSIEVKTEVKVENEETMESSENAEPTENGEKVTTEGETEEKNDDKDGKDQAEIQWDKNILLVRGMPAGEAGSLKQLLMKTLGQDALRIRPRVRGDANMYVLFRSHDEMKVAETLLHNQKFLKYKLSAKVVEGPITQKRPRSSDKKNEPPAKKAKSESSGQHNFLEGKYEDQIAFKLEDAEKKLHKMAKLLHGSYPKYSGLIFSRQLKHDGLICVLGEFKKCPADECYATRCRFSIGLDEETKLPAVGVRVPKGEPASEMTTVKNISTVNHNYPQHVIDAAKVFEKAVQASEVAPKNYKFWHELIIRTNVDQDLMLLVFVHCKQDSAADLLKRLNEELKEFFENGEGKQCRVVSLYTKAVCTDAGQPQSQSGLLEPVFGTPYLEETVMDFKLHLLPMMYFWNSKHAARLVCEGVEELLAPTKRIAVLEIGCGIGLIGFHLSKVAGEVLSVDVENLVEEAKKNAERNEIKDIQHYAGKAEDVIPEMAKKLTLNKACAIVISSANRFSTSPKAMEELRKIENLKRIVLVTEMSTSRFSPVIALAKTTTDKGLGNPFFPVKTIPVDTMPHSKSYVLLVLLERIGLNSLPKQVQKPEPLLKMKLGDGKSRFSRKLERKMFFNRVPGTPWQGPRPRFNQQQSRFGGPFNQFGGMPFGGSSSEFHLQQMLAEERRRRMEVEDQRRWLEEENRRRHMEERMMKKNPVQDLITDSLKEAGVPSMNSDAAQKLKEVIAEAIKSAGVLNKSGGGGPGPGPGPYPYGNSGWGNAPSGQAGKQGPQPLLGLKIRDPPSMGNEMFARRPFSQDYGPGGSFGQSDMPGGKPFYASNQDTSMYGRQGPSSNWSRGDTVQYPTGQYNQSKPNYSWQGSGGPSYATFDTSGSQRGGFRSAGPGKPRYFS